MVSVSNNKKNNNNMSHLCHIQGFYLTLLHNQVTIDHAKAIFHISTVFTTGSIQCHFRKDILNFSEVA